MSSTRFNPPVPNLEELSADGTTSPDSDGIVEFDGNDFAGSTNKRTLRSYISSLTRGEVPLVVAAPAQGIIEYNGPIPDHGNAYPLGDESNPQYTFTETGVEGGGINVMQNYSDSGQFSVNDKTLKNIVNKGELGEVDSLSHANGRDALSGHLLLQGVIGSADVNSPAGSRTDGAQVLIDAVPEILDDNNRYSPGKRTFDVNEDDDVSVEVSNLSDRIKISRDTEILSRSSDPNAGVITVEALSKVAVDIMLKATGKPNGPDAYPVAGVIPAMVQEGFKRVDSEDLRARTYSGIAGLNTTVEGTGIEFPNTDGVGETRYTDKSFGVTYNPLENFTGIGSSVTSYIALAGAAVGTVLAVGSVIAISTKPDSKSKPTYRNLQANPGTYLTKGKFKIEPTPRSTGLDFLGSISEVAAAAGISTDLSQIFNIYIPTNGVADFGQCVILGFASLIGASYDDEDVITEDFFLDGVKVFNKIGFFKILALLGIRAAAIAVTGEKGYYMNLFREIVKDSGSLVESFKNDPTSLLTPGEGFAAVANAKIVRFINVLAQIGDMIVLQVRAKDKYKFNSEIEDGDPYENGYKVSDDVDFNAKQSYAQQRIKGSRFGTKRGSSLGVSDLPSAHLIPDQYQKYLPEGSNKLKLTQFPKDTKSAHLRLSQDDVAKLERVLDAEYMPFYFQDLRTNEIVAFHAFLEDLNDSYTANYNNAGGYGRIEEVKTYKDTKRSVSVTFNVIAMNPDDFDYMWWQINKLTTLVYPQWSKGRDIRVSFGATSGTGQSDYGVTQPFSQIPTATPVIRLRIGDLIRSNYSRFNLKRLFGFKDTDKMQESGRLIKGEKVTLLGYTMTAGEAATVDQVLPDGTPSVGDAIDFPVDVLLSTSAVTLVEGTNNALVRIGVSKYLVPKDRIVERIDRKEVFTGAIDVKDFTESFYNPEENSVIRSFETTMGMGLAGVVTQLQFSWMDQGTLWGAGEDGPGYRAPRNCKVQISFDPIHDIAPGVDYEGLNRAPIYPVGNLVNRMVEGDEEEEPYGVGSTSYTNGYLKKG